jgi:hypothetical protein
MSQPSFVQRLLLFLSLGQVVHFPSDKNNNNRCTKDG